MASHLLTETKGQRDCPNCGTTQQNTFRLYWDDDTGELHMQITCVCQVDGDDETAYAESYRQAVPVEE